MGTSKETQPITWKKIKGHLRTITEHKLLVMRHCFRIGLYRQGLMHDLSKYMAWMHHKGRYRHHFEYWSDYTMNPTYRIHPLQPVQMPRKYVAEMLMDRISASKNYNRGTYTQHDPLQYFERGRSHYLMHPQTHKELHGMLRILDQRGEEELIRFVKDYYLKGYPI